MSDRDDKPETIGNAEPTDTWSAGAMLLPSFDPPIVDLTVNSAAVRADRTLPTLCLDNQPYVHRSTSAAAHISPFSTGVVRVASADYGDIASGAGR